MRKSLCGREVRGDVPDAFRSLSDFHGPFLLLRLVVFSHQIHVPLVTINGNIQDLDVGILNEFFLDHGRDLGV